MRAVSAALFLLLAVGPFAAHSRAEVKGFRVSTDRTIDSSSLETIVAQAIRRAGAKTNDEKAIAIYEYLNDSIFHYAYPTEAAPQTVGPLKVLNVYGWALCGGEHTVLKALFETQGWPCRYVGWSDPGHTTVEVKYDGKWHYLDVFLKCYYWSKDRSHIVCQEEIIADPSIVFDAVKDGRAARQNLCCGDQPQDVVKGCRNRHDDGDAKGDGNVTWRDEHYSPLLNLPSGASVRLDWKAVPGACDVSGKAPLHTCGTKDFRGDNMLGPVTEHYGTRGWSNGVVTYAPNFARAADLADVVVTGAKARGGKIIATGKGAAVFKLALPYPYVNALVEPKFEGGVGKVSLSTDGGITWMPVKGRDVAALVKQKYDVRVKVEFPRTLAGFRMDGVVEHNRGVLPYLREGKNAVAVALGKDGLPKGQVLRVTYVYQEATVNEPTKRDRFEGQGISYGEPKTVTKIIDALPCKFEIKVGGNTAPKMISLERAVEAK